MKTYFLKYFAFLTAISSLVCCKKEVKNDFSWEPDKKEAKTPKAPKTADSDFEFESESDLDEIETNQSEIKNVPDVKIVDGTLLTDSYNNYNTDGQLLYLAATKLCWDFNYKKIFGDYRNGRYKNGKERIKIDNCCTAFIPSPYISPMEHYYSQYHNINDIATYQNNVFKLREIRKKLTEENYESFQKLVMSVTPENLVSYRLIGSTIQSYDFDKKQLEIKYYISSKPRIGNKYSSVKLSPTNSNRYSSSQTYHIKMIEEEAKAIFDYYTSLNEYSKNPPFNLTTKTTYSLQIPNIEKRPYAFESRIKKIEFFKLGKGFPGKDDKIGEIQFNYNKEQNTKLNQ